MTIEFRRAPGVTAFYKCYSWVELAVSFIQAARASTSISHLRNYSRDVAGLYSFIRGTMTESEQIRAIDIIFAGKSGSIMPSQIGYLDAKRREKLSKKKRRDDLKNSMVEKMLLLS